MERRRKQKQNTSSYEYGKLKKYSCSRRSGRNNVEIVVRNIINKLHDIQRGGKKGRTSVKKLCVEHFTFGYMATNDRNSIDVYVHFPAHINTHTHIRQTKQSENKQIKKMAKAAKNQLKRKKIMTKMNFDYYFGFSFCNYDSLEVLFRKKYHPNNFYCNVVLAFSPFLEILYKGIFKHNLYDGARSTLISIYFIFSCVSYSLLFAVHKRAREKERERKYAINSITVFGSLHFKTHSI